MYRKTDRAPSYVTPRTARVATLILGLLAAGCSEPIEVRYSAERIEAAGVEAGAQILDGLRSSELGERQAAFHAACYLPPEAIAGFVASGGPKTLCKVAHNVGMFESGRPLTKVAREQPSGSSGAWLSFAVDHIGNGTTAAKNHIEPAMIVAIRRGIGADQFDVVRGRIAELMVDDVPSWQSPEIRIQHLTAVLDAFGERGTAASNDILASVARSGKGESVWPPLRIEAWKALKSRGDAFASAEYSEMVKEDRGMFANSHAVELAHNLGEQVHVTGEAKARIQAMDRVATVYLLTDRLEEDLPKASDYQAFPWNTKTHGKEPVLVPAKPSKRQVNLANGVLFRSWLRARESWLTAARAFPKSPDIDYPKNHQRLALSQATLELADVRERLAKGTKALSLLSDYGRIQFARAIGDALRAGVWGESYEVLNGIAQGLAEFSDENYVRGIYVDMLLVPENSLQVTALNWMKTKLTPAEATDAFFDRFRARNSYSVPQANYYVDAIASINESSSDQHIRASFAKAAKKARHAHRVDWMIKYVTVKALSRLGTSRALATLAVFKSDPNSIYISSAGGSKKDRKVIAFKKMAARAEAAIRKRQAKRAKIDATRPASLSKSLQTRRG